MLLKMTDEEYFRIDALSSSSIRTWIEDPKKYVAEYVDGKKRHASDSMRFGSLVHAHMLDRRELSRYQPVDGIEGKSKDAARAFSEAVAAHPGKIIVPGSIWDQAATAAGVFAGSAQWSSIRHEASGADDFRTEEVAMVSSLYGVQRQFKAKLDMMIIRGGDVWIRDLKTTKSIEPDEFRKSCRAYGYHIQAAHYVEIGYALGYQVKGYSITALENKPPYRSRDFSFSWPTILKAQEKLTKAAHEISQFMLGNYDIESPIELEIY